ncbi:nucleotidyltransferase family protein [Gaopeijia maritima]|uniref:Nucleotidyltransferase family protein n=1 Tax=Gaopeijia maritima TaxID=3119007 RepID=A0ABU9EEI1_9BACT
MVIVVEHLREQVEAVMRRRGVTRASVFGSVARGEATPESDVDFLVEFEKGRSLLDLSGLRLDLQDVLGLDVDVATPASLHPEMRDRILAELVRIL